MDDDFKDGAVNFNTFAYLRAGAYGLANMAKAGGSGSGYCRVSAVLFSAFAVEAHLNHIGAERLKPIWPIIEQKLSWQEKIGLMAEHFDITVDCSKRPFQTLKALFDYRNKLAHGKTMRGVVGPKKDGFSENHYPNWMVQFWSDDDVARVLDDTREIIELFLEGAGFPKVLLLEVSSGPDDPPDEG